MKKNKTIIVSLIVALALVLIVWRLYEGRQNNSGPIKIGVATIMSGDGCTCSWYHH
jgi:hypothetical protein